MISKNRRALRLGRINYLIINYLIINYLIILNSLQLLGVCLIKMSIKWRLSAVIMQWRPIYHASTRKPPAGVSLGKYRRSAGDSCIANEPPENAQWNTPSVFYLACRPSVRPFVCYRTYEHDILKTNEPISNLQMGVYKPSNRVMHSVFSVLSFISC